MLTVGSILSRERKKRNLTLKEVETQTRIRERYLFALEQNDWTAFSSKVYITGVIKNYARFLELDQDKMTAYFRRDYERLEDVKFKRRVETKAFTPQTRSVIIAGLISLFVVFGAYFGYQIFLYLEPPKVAIIAPKEKEFYSLQKITIIGLTAPDASISIFGERVYQNQEGEFKYDFPLQVGKNTLKVEVTGANGKKATTQETYTLKKFN